MTILFTNTRLRPSSNHSLGQTCVCAVFVYLPLALENGYKNWEDTGLNLETERINVRSGLIVLSCPINTSHRHIALTTFSTAPLRNRIPDCNHESRLNVDKSVPKNSSETLS